MTIDEASENYKIPMEILKEYENWGLCSEVKKIIGNWRYDEEDIKRLSLVMTLHDIGLSNEQVRNYMELELAENPSKEKQLKILNEMRSEKLELIHFYEKQLDRLDYLRFEIQKYNKQSTETERKNK